MDITRFGGFGDGSRLPLAKRYEVDDQLELGETALAYFAPDLDAELHFAEGLVVLTNRRLLCFGAARGENGVEQPENFAGCDWPLDKVTALRSRDRAGLGALELFGPAGRLAYWRYTSSRATAAHDIVNQFELARRGMDEDTAGEPEDADAAEAAGEGAIGAAVKASALLRLLKFARQRGKLILLGFVLTLASTVVGLIPPYLTIPLMDDILIPYQNVVENTKELRKEMRQQDLITARRQLRELHKTEGERFAKVIWYLVGLLAAAVAAWLLGWAQGVVMAYVSERISADLRNETYAHLHRLSLEFFGGKRTGDLMSRISTDTERICGFLSDNIVDFSTDVLMIIGTAVILVAIDPTLALVTLLPFPLIGVVVYRVRGQLQHGFRRGGRAWGQMTSILADTIPGIRVVKAFAQERREIDRFRRSNDQVVAANDKVNRVWTFFWPMVAMLNQVGLIVVWAFGAWRVFELYITVGVLTAFLAYISRFYMRLESMSRVFSATQRAAASAQRIFEILDRVPKVPEPLAPVKIGRVRGDVEFRDVSFRYGSRPILEHIDFKVGAGEMIGLVGPSGSGKSTLVNLVCRFYDVTEGAILVDGIDIRSFPVEQYRQHIGIVLQEPFLFFGTITENIAYGKPNATREEIMAAARAARAHDFIMRQPLGYDSLVGERGQSLSGGERQRISIARALLIDPRILFLDEATSAVDTETEREIQEALDNLIQGRTTIAIAHRLSTLRKADRLVVLERGHIVEVGQHAELLKLDGVYARLHQAQLDLAHGVAVE